MWQFRNNTFVRKEIKLRSAIELSSLTVSKKHTEAEEGIT